MCRLLGIYGKVGNWREIAQAFSKQAETGHVPELEKNDPGHKDGWGMAISNRKQTAMVPLIRQLGSAFAAPGYREALHTLTDAPDIYLCHLRKASDTVPITVSNAHPFFHNGWAFIHNGTVFKAAALHRDENLVLTSDDSDSEYLFQYLLTEIQDHLWKDSISPAIAGAVSSLRLDYTALNFMLSNGRELYTVRCFKKYEDHFTLSYYKLPDGIIICSEPIESKWLEKSHWTQLPNNSLMKIHGSPPQIEIDKI
jgi:predicted glutamine amidotransferase